MANIQHAQSMIARLNAAGINTRNFFALVNANGEGIVADISSGVPVAVDCDALLAARDTTLPEATRQQIVESSLHDGIYANGYVKNTVNFRRWVLSQVSHALSCEGGFTKWLSRKGYEYSIKQLLEELRIVYTKLQGVDDVAYNERRKFSPLSLAIEVAENDLKELRKYVDTLKIHRCRGRKYVRVGHTNIFCDELEARLFSPMDSAISNMITATEFDIYEAFKRFVSVRKELPYGTPMCKSYVDYYKGAGAFYAAKNLILFHDCKVSDGGRVLDRDASMQYWNNKLNSTRKGEFYKLLGYYKQFVEVNNFDFERRMVQLGVRQ